MNEILVDGLERFCVFFLFSHYWKYMMTVYSIKKLISTQKITFKQDMLTFHFPKGLLYISYTGNIGIQKNSFYKMLFAWDLYKEGPKRSKIISTKIPLWAKKWYSSLENRCLFFCTLLCSGPAFEHFKHTMFQEMLVI